MEYTQAGLQRVAGLITMSIASTLPVAAISVLYVVVSMPARLAIIAAFTILFTLALGIFTKARPVDIFVATTAYVAFECLAS